LARQAAEALLGLAAGGGVGSVTWRALPLPRTRCAAVYPRLSQSCALSLSELPTAGVVLDERSASVAPCPPALLSPNCCVARTLSLCPAAAGCLLPAAGGAGPPTGCRRVNSESEYPRGDGGADGRRGARAARQDDLQGVARHRAADVDAACRSTSQEDTAEQQVGAYSSASAASARCTQPATTTLAGNARADAALQAAPRSSAIAACQLAGGVRGSALPARSRSSPAMTSR
jgi:hypothetical protein